ncbi:hypothetical protein OEZ85_011789 [Tetradesmus obliquus]|uniref:Uncharacterized protein n=2 Tax=Tetradesmus obliquus TaxID=3088 RepID=A0ABY8TRD4_TETOB|nr:hypothetical protein OEZ85_011789 [Tetradesmus obliquus]|eukprot:jgi/Sobl393_1/16767/SZX63928.1
MKLFLIVSALLACSTLAAASCLPGDLPCACKEAGGQWRALKEPLKPVCTYEFKQKVNGQDMTRTFNVFLPAGYRNTRRYPVWMHIHGVYWGSMDNISQRMGWNVLAMDATANWDGVAGSDKVYNSAIVVYPQSTPSPYTNPDQRMLWNLPWWSCSAGSCVDRNIDEIAYIESVLKTVLSKLSVDKSKFWVTGTSAGGMMVNYLLCKSELFQRTATAVVDMLGGVGESFLGQCSPKVQLPHLILHGMEDPVITYWKDNVVDGSNFISTLKMAKWWQGLRGCKGEPRDEYNDQTLECHVYCEGGPASERAERRPMGRKTIPMHGKEAAFALRQQGAGPILKLCGMKGVGHDLNTPYQGYPFDIAWEFFKKQSGL